MRLNIKDCFTGHSLVHNLMGVGLGFLLVSLIPSLGNLWLGVALVVVAAVADMMRK